jgi:uncharacterized protein
MELRDFGKRSGFKVRPVSIGAMRLPGDLDEAVRLLRHAIDSGMTYIDTCRCYDQSEWIIGKALKDGYRHKVILSTKWSPWIKKIRPTDDTSADCERRRIEESMKRLDVDYLDYYQLWNIDSPEHYQQAVAKGGMLEAIVKAKEEKLIGHIGFTTHAPVPELLKIIDEADWCEIILFTYHLLDLTYKPAIDAAHKKGIGTLVMNPLGGGRLAEPSPVLSQLAQEAGAVSVPDLAIRFLLSDPHIDTILSGIVKQTDVDESIASAERPPFSKEQMAKIQRFLGSSSRGQAGICTGCKYCMPCPQGIDIPKIMDSLYFAKVWGLTESGKETYAHVGNKKADACIGCGVCESKCTQKLKIAEAMDEAAKMFASTANT